MNRRLLAGVVAIVVGSAVVFTSPTAVVDRLTWLAADPIRFAIALCVLAAVRPLLAWPTTLIAVAVGYGYGWAGVPFGVLLLTLTALPPYWFALAARDGTPSRVTRGGQRFVGAVGDVRAVIASRLLPTPSDAVSIAAGVAGVRLRPFLLGTAVGELPWVLVGVAIGASADRVVTGDFSGLDPALFIGMAAVAVLLLAGPMYRHYRASEFGMWP